jgi:hypothetical protein
MGEGSRLLSLRAKGSSPPADREIASAEEHRLAMTGDVNIEQFRKDIDELNL